MAKVKIITDSTADVPEELVKEFNIRVVPLTVNFGDASYKDGIDITTEQFFEKLVKSDVLPTTSQVTPGQFEDIFREELKENDSIICVTLSSKASGTYQAAMIAKDMFDDANITIIDSMLLSYSYGMIVVDAARMAAEGKGHNEIASMTEERIKKIQVYFIVDTLEYLKKGGRLSSAQAIIGSMLDIKPVLGLKDGMVVPIDKIRGKKRVMTKIVEIIKSRGHTLDGKKVSFAHGLVPDKLEEFKEAILNEFNPASIEETVVGCVIGTHAGPGVLALFFEE